MANLLGVLFNPLFKHNVFIDFLSEFRKGGITPDKKESFKKDILLFNNNKGYQNPIAFQQLIEKYQLSDLSKDDLDFLMLKIQERGRESIDRCWHPLASTETCSKDKLGRIDISEGHSIQNNRILNLISENKHLYGHKLNSGKIESKMINRHSASTFRGFCNTHDAIFNPIEKFEYTNTSEQNFLFAYRAFTVTAHVKLASGYLMKLAEQAINDTSKTKEIFDSGIAKNDFNIITTKVVEFNNFYPFSVSSSFYLDFDFEGKPIPHSEERMENIYITFFPRENKSYFLLSYLTQDTNLYGNLTLQMNKRNNLESDVSVMILGHAENIFFKPSYYNDYIKQQEISIDSLLKKTQYDFVKQDDNGDVIRLESLTPSNY